MRSFMLWCMDFKFTLHNNPEKESQVTLSAIDKLLVLHDALQREHYKQTLFMLAVASDPKKKVTKDESIHV